MCYLIYRLFYLNFLNLLLKASTITLPVFARFIAQSACYLCAFVY